MRQSIGYNHSRSPAMVAGRNAIQEIPVERPMVVVGRKPSGRSRLSAPSGEKGSCER